MHNRKALLSKTHKNIRQLPGYGVFLTILFAVIGLLFVFGPQRMATAQSVSSPFMIQPASPLIPGEIGVGDKFRLIFVTSTKRTADSTSINDYNTFVQTVADNNDAFKSSDVNSNTIANIQAVGSTATDDARDNTGMWNSGTSVWHDADDNVPIYWVNGDKVADSYSDFYDGSWKLLRQNAPRNESGERMPSGRVTVWTGSNDNGTKHSTNPLGASHVLWGAVGLVTDTDINPIGNTATSHTASNTTEHHLYGITPVFQVEKVGIQFDDSGKNFEVGEGDDAKVTLLLTAPAQEAVTITVNTANGTAIAPADYVAGSYQVAFAKGEQSKTFTIPTVQDTINENVETFGISVQTSNLPNWLTLLSTSGSNVSIREKVELTLASVNTITTVVEGSETQFTITANKSPDADLEVNYRVTNGPGHEYVDESETGLLTTTILAGETTATISVGTQDDSIDRPALTGDGQITVAIDPHYNNVYTLGSSNSVSLPVHDSQATLISITPVISGNPGHLVEGGIYQFNIAFSRELVAPEEITIPFTFSGTALYGTDYKLLCPTFSNLKNMTAVCNGFDGNSPSITFTGGNPAEHTDSIVDIQMHAFLQILKDSIAETTPETITITLDVDTTSGVTLRGGAQGSTYSSTIQDPPTAATVQFSQGAFTVNEASGVLEATVILSTPLGSDLTLPITITEQGATRGTDFILADNGIIIKAGESAATFSVDIPNDDLAEANEQFSIAINTNQLPSSPTAITAGTNTTTTVTIIDDDPLQIAMTSDRKIIWEGGKDATITLTLNRPLQVGEALTVPLTISGDADQGTDYTLTETVATGVTYAGVGTANVTVSFAPGTATTATFTVHVPDDSTEETLAETVTLTIGNLSFTKVVAENPDPLILEETLNLYLFDPLNHKHSVILTPQGIDPYHNIYVGEENMDTLQVSLLPAPTAQVTAQVAINSGSSHATIQGGSLTFTPTDYRYKEVSILGTPDTDTNELDTVVVRITLTSTDEQYNNKTYDQTVQIVDNDTPITLRLTGSPSINIAEGNQVYRVYLTSNRRLPIMIPEQLFSLDFATTAGNFIAANDVAGPLPDEYDIEWGTPKIPIGENQGFIEIDTKDDDMAERDAAAIATLSFIDDLPEIAIHPDHNMFTIRHPDDDVVIIQTRHDAQGYHLYTSRGGRDFPLSIEPQAKTGPNPTPLTMEEDDTEITLPDENTLKGIVVRTPEGFHYTPGKWYRINRGDGDIPILVLSHGDPVPSSFDPHMPEVSITSAGGVVEGSNAVFTLTGSPAPTANLPVVVSVSQSGTYGVTTGSRTVTIPTGGTVTLTVTTSDDNVDEVDGSVTVTITAGSGYTVSSSQGSATATISDDDGPVVPEVSITSAGGVVEGSNAVFTLTGSPAPTANLPVVVSVSQSGTYGVTTGSRTVTIPTGGTVTLTVTTSDDNVDEVDGSVTVTITAGSGYTVSSSQGSATATISDDDGPVVPEVSITSAGGVVEGSNAVFTLTGSPAPTANLPVVVSVSQSGTYGVTTGSRTVTIPTGGTVTLTVTTSDDNVDEVDGSVTVTITAGSGYTVSSSQGSATATISDDDGPVVPEVSITSAGGVVEGSNAVFTLTGSPAPTANLPVVVSVSQSGTYGVTTGSRTVTIPTGGTVTLTVTTSDDNVDEVDGSVTVTITAGSGYTVSSSQGSATATISDDDGPVVPEVSITSAGGVVEGSNAVFTLTGSPAPTANLPVVVSVSQSGTYGVTTGSRTVTIPTGGTVTLTVTTSDDNVDEADGSVTVTITAGSGYTVSSSQGSATATISDDDGPVVPEVSITSAGGVVEGSNAVFTLTGSPAPTANLPVVVSVSQSGTYGVTTGSRTVTIPTGGTVTLTVTTSDDNVDEVDGSVTVTITAGSGYTVSSSQGSATATISDDDGPVVPVNNDPPKVETVIPLEKVSLSIISITSDGATATWSTLPNTDQYTVRWWKTGTQASTSMYQIVSTNYEKIDNLQPNTAYTVEVVPRVHTSWQEAQKSPAVSFTTRAQ